MWPGIHAAPGRRSGSGSVGKKETCNGGSVAAPLATRETPSWRLRRGLIDRRCTRPETPTFRRWSFPSLSLLGAGAHETALGCGGLSRRLTRHSHRRARRPLPLLRTGDAHRHNSLGGVDGLTLASATLCTGSAAFPWPDASPTPFPNFEGRLRAALRPARGRLDDLHPGAARGTAVGAVRGACVRVLG